MIMDCLASLVREVIQSGRSDAKEGETKREEKGPSSGEIDSPEESNGSNPCSSLLEIIQLASVALSDGLQMTDDLIRSTLQRSQVSGASSGVMAPVDSAVVKLAVQKNARKFGVWLASTLERLVGCEPSEDGDVLLEVWEEENEEETKKKMFMSQLEREDEFFSCNPMNITLYPGTSHLRKDCTAERHEDECNTLITNLLRQLDDEASDEAYSNFLLAICEMCRLAERSMANTLNQSIQSAMEEDSRAAESANTLFATTINPHRKGKDGLDVDHILAQRFQLATSRALAMYIMNRGAYAASELCTDMSSMSDARDPYAIPSRPREECLRLFEIIKRSCEDCISIVGGDLFAAPVAPFPEENEYNNVFGLRLTQHSAAGGGGGASRGLKLDVEKLFIEKIQVFPHSLDQLEFNRNSVVSGILRVALASFLECVRSSIFSSSGYRQMKVDAIFLRYLLPHYVKDEFGTPEASACTCLFNLIDDIMLIAGQRCVDPEIVGDDEYYDAEKDEIVSPYWIVQQFLSTDQEGKGQQDFGRNNTESVMKRISFL